MMFFNPFGTYGREFSPTSTYSEVGGWAECEEWIECAERVNCCASLI